MIAGSSRSKVLVTGATGFVGRPVCDQLSARGCMVAPAVRDVSGLPNEVVTGDIGPLTDWSDALTGCNSVVHLAARVHVMRKTAVVPANAYAAVNTAGTLNLALQAATAGVRRFVFLSSIKVNGEETIAGCRFGPADAPSPQDAYATSKADAEAGLRSIASATSMECVIVRAPLVYGPGVKGNFAEMMRAVARGLPLPFGAVTDNRRSLVGLDNLVDLIVTCIDHPAAANQTFLVSDGEDLSTADLLRRLGAAMGKPARLLNIPPALLGAAAAFIGKRAVAQRLLGNLQVDISHTCRTLGWKPPISVDEGLRRAVQGAMR